MKGIASLKREIAIVSKAISPKEKPEWKQRSEKLIDILREYEEAWNKETEGMTDAEKAQFDLKTAEATAKAYAEGKL